MTRRFFANESQSTETEQGDRHKPQLDAFPTGGKRRRRPQLHLSTQLSESKCQIVTKSLSHPSHVQIVLGLLIKHLQTGLLVDQLQVEIRGKSSEDVQRNNVLGYIADSVLQVEGVLVSKGRLEGPVLGTKEEC